MKNKKDIKKSYLVIHGHFYQPPRENPWLEAIEIQKSAHPFHDWNERINEECYRPNAFSKIFNSKGEIIKVVNNYSKMSFNFGPTLLSWLEKNDFETYNRILEADKESLKEYSGHGNALAQVYNHIIMPLADKEDKNTQILWGIKDFESRFKRKPEGMWLAETAIDYKTVDALIENDIKFTILSPYQAKNTREMEKKEWKDVLGGKIDSTKPYRCYSKTYPNKYIDIFFYDGPISSSIGFEDTVKDSSKYISRLKLALNEKAEHSQIVNIATDGETYGHHKKFADLTLAHLLFDLAPKNNFEVINYGYYLEKFGVVDEVELNEGKGEGTSWSCAHGVDRWKDDCGCNSGGNYGWNQKWRKPLRDGLNKLRDILKEIYGKEATPYFKDIWKARNEYVDVVLNRSLKNVNDYFKRNLKKEVDTEEQEFLLKLLEIQRNLLLMFTSCGWFFDEISGLETIQILSYASKAIQLAQDYTNQDIEKIFTNYLEEAKSNIKEFGTGKDIYFNMVKSRIVDFDKMVAHYAISSSFYKYSKKSEIFTYEIERDDFSKIEDGNLILNIGKVKIKNLITNEFRYVMYGVLKFGNMDFRCSVKNIFSNTEYFEIKREILKKIEKKFSIVESMRALDMYINSEYYTFNELLLETKRKILKKVTGKFFEDYKNTYEKIYTESSQVISALLDAELSIPEEYRIAAEYTFKNKITNLLEEFLENLNSQSSESELVSAIMSSKKLNYKIVNDKMKDRLKEKLNILIDELQFEKIEIIEDILKLFNISKLLKIDISTNHSQEKVYKFGLENYDKLSDINKNKFIELIKNLKFSEKTFDVIN
ncbi:DUF3536 domain-containing protein [Haliovirga abyssi]|uniref:Glycoside hydrolase n=1 Tax=Haliovirga abyssi TaxID=2996794 RepID=A0AAU9DQD9_9FUSO|nr:DUF3536 domain-containing protein [Haliovirga abyssi]BDU50683.1 glycoside hydrolase [Haliovirga abyssi]